MTRRLLLSLTAVLLAVTLLLQGCSARLFPSFPRQNQQGEPADPSGGSPAPGSAAGSTPSHPPERAPTPAPVPAPVPAPEPAAPPAPRVTLAPEQVLQGDMVTLRIDQPVAGPVSIQVEGLSEQPRPFYQGGRMVAFVGFPAHARTGSYPVQVTWEGGQWSGAIEVVRKRFTEDRLVVTAEQEAIYYDPRAAEEWRRVFAARASSHPHPLWHGPFLLPLKEPMQITTYFGEIRFVNGVETGRHSGMDFGAPTGAPVTAPTTGRVVMAERLIVTGWTLIIDHGLNLFSVYYHLDVLFVTQGELVQPGELIGTVGSTGFSTGPHLHWTITIGNTPVDPWPFTQGSPLGIERPLDPSLTPA